jgi:hypothetical protein
VPICEFRVAAAPKVRAGRSGELSVEGAKGAMEVVFNFDKSSLRRIMPSQLLLA